VCGSGAAGTGSRRCIASSTAWVISCSMVCFQQSR
jgi:hypothetical protein